MTALGHAQYADDHNLRARQRLWSYQQPAVDLFTWTIDLAAVRTTDTVLDVGCGNGNYLRVLRTRGATAVGCDLSIGMLASAGHDRLVNADAASLPFRTDAFDVVVAAHMLYHVDDREHVARELRRVLRPGGVCVAVTNGARSLREVHEVVESAVRLTTPGWEMRTPSTHVFSLENGPAQLSGAFDVVETKRPEVTATVRLRDADVVANYVASIADHYEDQINGSWHNVVTEVRRLVQKRIDADGAFVTRGDVGALVCS